MSLHIIELRRLNTKGTHSGIKIGELTLMTDKYLKITNMRKSRLDSLSNVPNTYTAVGKSLFPTV